MDTTVPHLPDDVVVEILVRLPARYIAGCRAVCRAWRSAISHPIFDRVHSSRPTAVATITAEHKIERHGVEGGWIQCRSVNRVIVFDFTGFGPQRTPFPRALCFTSPLLTSVMGSWDGVVCLQRSEWQRHPYYFVGIEWPPRPSYGNGFHIRQYVLWNPLTMACATVGPPSREGCIIGGYAHPETRRFHLLHASGETDHGPCHIIRTTIFRILRVGDAVWRELRVQETSADADAAPPRIIMNRSPRCVRLHDNLHWLVESIGSGTSTVRLLALDTTREKFWSMETPERHGRPFYLMTTRISVLPGGKLCLFSVEQFSSTMEAWMEVWVLEDYPCGPRGSWRWLLKERISLVTWEGFDLRTFFETNQIETVEDGEEGEEVLRLKQANGRIDAYNFRRKAWRTVACATFVCTHLVMHRESVLQGQASFGSATRPLWKYVDWYGQRFYCLE
ncbi:hypothetical protein CFC21_022736 [Triticum aestivum]|uniref:F-box domain-containing protein n=2 Tax=Triticum aestivum TaxID=4565 RepID=A0A3B6C3G1_WHEAT|nr:hypothetical protein CFC21_022736 [Triticum aestivum]